jgi:hypothetical protein
MNASDNPECDEMNMSNIAHTINGDDVTLGWDTDDLT